MKKIIIALLFIPVSFCAFSASFGFGPMFCYEPGSKNLFRFEGSFNDNFNSGMTFEYYNSRHFSIITDAVYKSDSSDEFDLELNTYFSYRKNLPLDLYFEAGMGLAFGIETAVEESNTLYFTLNGIRPQNFTELSGFQFIFILGIFRPRLAFGMHLGNACSVRLDYVFDCSTMVEMIYQDNPLVIPGNAKLSLAAMVLY